jgi:PfaD family protein
MTVKQAARPLSSRIGWWANHDHPPETGTNAIRQAIQRVTEPLYLVDVEGTPGVGRSGRAVIEDGPFDGSSSGMAGFPLLGYVPPLHPEDLGDPHFKAAFRLRYPYVVGAMANGITSVRMVEAAARAGMIGFFGAAGLPLQEIEKAIVQLQDRLGKLPFGVNLIHSPNEPDLEKGTVDLYLERGIRLVSASAYLDLTLPLVYYRVKGIHRDANGQIVTPQQIIAKISRIEVARKFFSPPPERILRQLVDRHWITSTEAELAQSIPVAETMTAEADSGGHTDNQPAISLLPTILALRDRMTERYGYPRPLCVGLGGGIATPGAAAAAFALGAAYILTGSINQACTEAGTSGVVRSMLADASQADVAMAPAADMFEMGVKVQVLKRGTMFPFRAAKLYDIYTRYKSLEDIPDREKQLLERDFFRCSCEDEWRQTKAFFNKRDPRQILLAEDDPKHKMALVFRSYLGQSSSWANCGEPTRKIDYQIWCGPAMGAFNEWVKGSFLEKPENRSVITLALNLLVGAAIFTRYRWLTAQKALLPLEVGIFRPLNPDRLLQLLDPRINFERPTQESEL